MPEKKFPVGVLLFFRRLRRNRVKKEISIVAAFFVLAFLFCGVSLANESAGSEKVYLLCKSETGKLEVITTTPEKVMSELETLKNSNTGNYTVIVGDDSAEAGYYMISVGDEPAGAISGGALAEDGNGNPVFGSNNSERWFERKPMFIFAEVGTVVLLLTLGWYYKRKLPLGR